jgi:formate hydrogenlyase subunit 3/multisubunit Na+/H+ antiporter MnhD subunit
LSVLLASSLLAAFYLGQILYKAYFEPETEAPAHGNAHEVSWMVAPLVISAAASLLLGLFPNFVLALAGRAMP